MIDWPEILRRARQGNPEPLRAVVRSEAEWRAQLSPEAFDVMRRKATERPFSSALCSRFEPGLYACAGCAEPLFDAGRKFDSGTGWPSFSQPVSDAAIGYVSDESHGSQRIEVVCNVCQSHLGHVFPDGPAPAGLRYCINALALQRVEAAQAAGRIEQAVFGGGCFWCTEALFARVPGVLRVVSGYAGGQLADPGYDQVCSGRTGHAEVVQIHFDPSRVGYADLLAVHLASHDPTTLNRQGADCGTQYRSIVLTASAAQAAQANDVLAAMATAFDAPIVTEIRPLEVFYPAEADHQDYYRRNAGGRYCQLVIKPKLEKLHAVLTAHAARN
jgi:peptide methionine sulfoxide reductase msrA/msrB